MAWRSSSDSASSVFSVVGSSSGVLLWGGIIFSAFSFSSMPVGCCGCKGVAFTTFLVQELWQRVRKAPASDQYPELC